MRFRCIISISCALLWAGQALASVIVNDTFGDGNIGTNTDGTGTGFQWVSNTAGSGSSSSVSESSGQALVETIGSSDNTGLVSKDPLTVIATDKVNIFWDIASVTDISQNGLELNVQQSTDFRVTGHKLFNLRFSPGGTLTTTIWDGIGSESVGGTASFTLSELNDGFTATLVADSAGWDVSFTGLPSLTSFSSADYGSVISFADLFNGGRAAATVQGTTPAATLTLNQITADVTAAVPEPGTAVLFLLGAGLAVGLRKMRFRS